MAMGNPRSTIFSCVLMVGSSQPYTYTRGNLSKRQHVEYFSCMVHNEPESVSHFLFCSTSHMLFGGGSSDLSVSLPKSIHDICLMWFNLKKMDVPNMLCVATLCSLWIVYNKMHF